MDTKKRIALPLFFLCGAVVVLSMAMWGEKEAAVKEEREEKRAVVQLSEEEISQANITFERVQPREIVESFGASGKVLLNQSAEAYVVPRVKGIVVEVLKGTGRSVDKGETIAWIDSVEVAEAKARYLRALKEEELALAVFESQRTLQEKQIISQHEFWEAARDIDEAAVESVVARQYLKALGLGDEEIDEISRDNPTPFSLYPLKTPIAGSIISASLTLGEMVDSDRQAYLVSNLDQLHVELAISPKDIRKVQIGQECIISTLKGDQETTGVISSITPAIDNKTRLGRAVCVIPNTDRSWTPGTFVNARVITAKNEVPFAVEKRAVKNYEGAHVIFIRNEEGFVAKEVCLGRCDGKYVEIVDKMEGDDEYVADNAFILKAQFTNRDNGE